MKTIMWPTLIILMHIYLVSTGQSTQPNILWITIEDTSPQFIGCYGNKDARTPNIDKLAAGGVRFTNAFSTNTVCSPSRTSIITGVRTYETGTGHHRSKYAIPDFMSGFPYYLQQAGYYTSNNSKTDYNIADEKTYIRKAWNESSDSAGWWKRKAGQPFFAVFNFMDSHQSRTMTNSYKKYTKEVLDELPVQDRIGENEFSMPPFFRDSREMRKQFARVYNSLKLTDNKIGELLKQFEKDHLIDSTIIFFFSDHGEGIPRGKTNGINLGYRVPFVIWFPPAYQHLSPWGTRVVTDELIDFADLAPTVISLAGGKVPDYMKGRVMLGKNRSPRSTYIELSSDRSDNGIDMVRSVTDGRYLYSRNYMPFMPQARYINYMETGEIKKIMRRDLAMGNLNPHQRKLFDSRPASFLFDTQKDPWELNNLATDSRYKKICETMQQILDSCILQSRDIMFLPEYEIAAISGKKLVPYEYRLNERDYPFREIYKTATLCGKRGKSIAQQQAAWLTEKNDVVRYWAALGLRSQSTAVLQPYKQQILLALHDPYPPARITAAVVAFEAFNDPGAAAIIKEFLYSSNQHLALMAVNYLLYSSNPAPFLNTIKDILSRQATAGNVKWGAKDLLNRMGSGENTQKAKVQSARQSVNDERE